MLKTKQKQIKKIIVLLVTLTVLGGSGFAYWLYSGGNSNSPLVKLEKEANQEARAEIVKLQQQGQNALANIQGTLDTTNPQEMVIQEVSIIDLDIYPINWVKNNFNEMEQRNQMISGKNADPDMDELSNRLEFAYGSDPKNAYTLCGSQSEGVCAKNDKENIDLNINPLTGFEMDAGITFRIKNIDKEILKNLENSFGTASAEGVNFPELYQIAKKIDVSKDLESVNITEIENNRDNILLYVQYRLEILKDFADLDDATTFTKIYTLIDPANIAELKSDYIIMKDQLTALPTPSIYRNLHKSTILTLERLIKVMENRENILSDPEQKLGTTEEAKQNSKQLAIDLLAAYQRLNIEEQQLQRDIEGESNQ